MASRTLYVVVTMDCEPVRAKLTPHAREMSFSGPVDDDESERSMRGYAAIAAEWGYPTTLFAHPEVAASQPDVLLDLEAGGACLGLHVHPYKLDDGRYLHDLGAYGTAGQRTIVGEAMQAWGEALGKPPLYFRPGCNSANDATYGVLLELGFRGGSIAAPHQAWASHQCVWTATDPYPHRADLNFRQFAGDSDFVDVPMSVDFQRPSDVREDWADYEWLNVFSTSYDLLAVVRDLMAQFQRDQPRFPALVMDTHNDQDYTDADAPASRNLRATLGLIDALAREMNMQPVGATVADLVELVLAEPAGTNSRS